MCIQLRTVSISHLQFIYIFSFIFNYYFRIEIIEAWAYRGAHFANTHTVRNLLFFILFLLFAFFCHRKRFVHFTTNTHTHTYTQYNCRLDVYEPKGAQLKVCEQQSQLWRSFGWFHFVIHIFTFVFALPSYVCWTFFFLFRFSAEHKLRQPTMGFLLFSFFLLLLLSAVSSFLSFFLSTTFNFFHVHCS